MGRITWLGAGLLALALVSGILGGIGRPVAITQAQGSGALSYGSSVTGTISSEVPLALFIFNGTAGDLVHVDVLGLSGGLHPALDLIDPNRETLASSHRNSLAANPLDAHIVLVLPSTGAYSLVLGGAEGTTGDFLLQLAGRAPVTATPLVFGQEITVPIPQAAEPQYFSFAAEDCPTTLTVMNPTEPEAPASYPFIVKVRDERAQTVALLRGGDALEDRVTVEPLSGTYEVEVWSDDATLAGEITLLVSCAGDAPPCLTGEAGAPGAADVAAACPECEPCENELNEDPGLCGEFAITIDELTEGGLLTFSWPAVEDTLGVVYEIVDQTSELIAARLVETAIGTSDTVDLSLMGTGPGEYTIIIHALTEEEGYVCHDETTIELEGIGPVEWGPAAEDDECTVELVAPLETIANGLQTFFWSDVPGAESYWLRVYGQFDSVVAFGTIAAPATSLTLDVSEAAIGAGYGGEEDFFIQINVMRGDESWCSTGVRVRRGS